jgi:cytochrome c oxidase subunit II
MQTHDSKIPSAIYALLAGMGIAGASYWYGQNNGLMPIAASEEATHVDALFNAMIAISTGLFIIVQGVIIFSAIKYRRKAGDTTDGPAIEGNVPLEILWTAIPAAIVLWISIYSFEIYGEMGGFDPTAANDMHAMHGGKHTAIAATLQPENPMQIASGIGASPASEGKPAGVTVNVLGLQYAWIFTYPETSITSGELHVPLGQEVQLNLKAQDVLHALWIPQLRLKQDTIPGEMTQLRFTTNRVGTYPVRCAELCGGYHGSMVTTMVVHSPEDYKTWVASQTQPATTAAKFDFEKAIAMNPLTMPTRDYLAPYAREMGVQPEMLARLVHQQQPHHQPSKASI